MSTACPLPVQLHAALITVLQRRGADGIDAIWGMDGNMHVPSQCVLVLLPVELTYAS